jgi:hypothetical protein
MVSIKSLNVEQEVFVVIQINLRSEKKCNEKKKYFENRH